jgi:glyoxalase family protein
VRFEDPEGQRLVLMDDGGAPFSGVFWERGEVPAAHALRGFYAAMLSTPKVEYLEPILTQVLEYREVGRHRYPGTEAEVIVYEMDEGGPGCQVWVVEEPDRRPARQGAGGVHHVAFRVTNQAEQQYWRQRITRVGLPVSQFIDRYYFHSIYFRISNGILFEIATDGPGFTADEDLETLGEKLALPPFLESRRPQIEANLKPIVTT